MKVALAAIDPWVVDFESCDGDDDRRFAALERFSDVLDEYSEHLEALRFLDGSFWARYYEFANRMSEEDPEAVPPIHDYLRVLARLRCDDEGPIPDIGAPFRWLLEVCT